MFGTNNFNDSESDSVSTSPSPSPKRSNVSTRSPSPHPIQKMRVASQPDQITRMTVDRLRRKTSRNRSLERPKFRVQSPASQISFIEEFMQKGNSWGSRQSRSTKKRKNSKSPKSNCSPSNRSPYFSFSPVILRRDSQSPGSPWRSPNSPHARQKSDSPQQRSLNSPNWCRKNRHASQPIHMNQSNLAKLEKRRKSLGHQNKKSKKRNAGGRRTSNFLELPGMITHQWKEIIYHSLFQMNTTGPLEMQVYQQQAPMTQRYESFTDYGLSLSRKVAW